MYVYIIPKCDKNKDKKRNSTRKRSLQQHLIRTKRFCSLSFVEDYSSQPVLLPYHCVLQPETEPDSKEAKPSLLFSWRWRIITFLTMVVVLLMTMMMVVVVLLRLIVYWRSNKTLGSCNSCFLGLLVVTSIVEDDGESLCGAWISRVPFPKFW